MIRRFSCKAHVIKWLLFDDTIAVMNLHILGTAVKKKVLDEFTDMANKHLQNSLLAAEYCTF